jgi:hypothetical protein
LEEIKMIVQKIRRIVLAATPVAFGLLLAATNVHAQIALSTLPPFSRDINPIQPSVIVSEEAVTPRGGPTRVTSSFVLKTPFTSVDFPDDICDAPNDAVLHTRPCALEGLQDRRTDLNADYHSARRRVQERRLPLV